MNLDALIAEAGRRADERFDDVLIRILTADLPEFVPPKNCCRKCGPLLTEYVRCRIAEHRFNSRHYWSPLRDSLTEKPGYVLRMRVEAARSAFHSTECECGLQLWRGRRWREGQGSAYMNMWQAYVSVPKEERT